MRLEAGAIHDVLHSLEEQTISSEISDLAECICPLSTDCSNQEARTVFARCLWVLLHFQSWLKFGHPRSQNHLLLIITQLIWYILEMQINEAEALFYISRLSAILQRQLCYIGFYTSCFVYLPSVNDFPGQYLILTSYFWYLSSICCTHWSTLCSNVFMMLSNVLSSNCTSILCLKINRQNCCNPKSTATALVLCEQL